MGTNRDELYNDPELSLRIALDGRQAQIYTAMPGIVKAVNMADMTCTVQPAIKGAVESEDGSVAFVALPLLIKVPIQFPKGGGFIFTVPLAIGDEVLVIWSCRAIDAWWQSSGVQKPIEARMHDLSDGFAIPGISSVPNAVPAISTTAAQLRNTAGTQYVSLKADGSIEIKSAVGTKVTGDLDVAGDLTVEGEISATGDVLGGTASPGTTISLLNHTHTSATPGNPTSPPLP